MRPSLLATDENKVPTSVQRFSDLSFHLTETLVGNLSPAQRGRRMNQTEAEGLGKVVKARLRRAVLAPEAEHDPSYGQELNRERTTHEPSCVPLR